MTTIQFPDSKEIEIQAANWIAAIDRGLSNAEELELKDWLEVSSLHGETLVKCASMWDLLDLLSPIAKLMPIAEELNNNTGLSDVVASDQDSFKSSSESLERKNNQSQWKPFYSRGWAIAASAAVVAISAWVAVNTFSSGLDTPNLVDDVASSAVNVQSASLAGQEYVTAIGEISNVSLADGSKLKLNTDSAVRVHFSSSERKVDLLRGEVFFDVAKDPSKPFVVEARSEQVTAVGTAFSVDLSHSVSTEVLVTEGKVRVGSALSSAPSPYPELFLTPGQKVVIRDNQPEVSINHDAESQLAWRQGIVVFEGETLEQAISEIDRYTPLSFKIIDDEIATIPVGGYFKTGDLEQLLLVLEQNFGVKSYRLGDEVLLSKAP